MRSLGERWRAGRSAFVVLVGCAIAFGGNVVLLASIFLTTPSDARLVPSAIALLAIALSLLTAWIVLAHPPHTAKRFAIIAISSSAIVLLNVPGLVGGAIAVAGGILGTLARHEGLQEGARP